MHRIGNRTIGFDRTPAFLSSAAVVGPKEAEGPLAKCFDVCFEDSFLGQDTWEKAESMLQKHAVETALAKKNIRAGEIDLIFAGDLLNQCTASCFGLMDFDIPYVGIYGACSTMALTIINASIAVESGAAEKAIAVTSSHFCSAERQYRFPLEYGGVRPLTSQWTVTGSGAAVIGLRGKIRIESCTVGKIIDYGIKDANNMGAAMAPAAADTIASFLGDTVTAPSDYDCIFTGDLGSVGSELLYKLLSERGVDIRKVHKDCGCMIFDPDTQDVHSGGSGCGCSASVLCSYILQKIEQEEYHSVLFCATGALLSPTTSQQGESIPSVAHLIHIKG